jgi:DNA-binding MarR family transcriptional regulator
MRDRELVSTAKDAADARVTLVRLTETGLALRAAVVERRRSTLAWAVQHGGLTLADLPTADRIVKALDGAR